MSRTRAILDGRVLAARTSYLAEQLGWAGLTGLLALVLAVTAAISAWVVLPQSSRALEARQIELQRRVEATRQSADPVATDSPEQWTAALADASNALVFIEALQTDASARSLQIETTEYRRELLLNGKVLRYRVTMPVRGSYPALRVWLEEMLHRFPTVALDELALRRDEEGGAAVVGRVHFSHYSRTGP